MGNSSLIKLVLTKLGCNQQDLAHKLNVSTGQVSKWKSNAYMSEDMTQRLTELAGIGVYDSDFVYWTGGLEQSKKWYKLINDIADRALMECETGYNTTPLQIDEDTGTRHELCSSTIRILKDMGITIPDEFPAVLTFDEADIDWDDDVAVDSYSDRGQDDPIYRLIYDSYIAFNHLYGFFRAYIADIVFDMPEGQEQWEMFDHGLEMECELLSLAFSKTGTQNDFMSKFGTFSYETDKYFKRAITHVKKYAIKHHIPIKAELDNLLLQDSEDSGMDAERESLGLNPLHPDVYMNEILEHLRYIGQILPVICNKLGIEENDYLLNAPEPKL